MDLPQTEGMDIDEEIRARRITMFLTACSQTAWIQSRKTNDSSADCSVGLVYTTVHV